MFGLVSIRVGHPQSRRLVSIPTGSCCGLQHALDPARSELRCADRAKGEAKCVTALAFLASIKLHNMYVIL